MDLGVSEIWCVYFFVFVFVDLGEKMTSHHVGQVLTEQKYLSVCGRKFIKRSECPPPAPSHSKDVAP